jgi:hypothetical protein
MLKKVIDAGALRSPALERFLRTSPNNIAVITDYASMESFKGEGAVNIRRSLQIVGRFPKQVLILKSTAQICALRPRLSGLHSRLVDRRQTVGFVHYCRSLFSSVAEPERVAYDVASKSRIAREHFARIEEKAAAMGPAWDALFQSYDRDDLANLRRRRLLSARLVQRILRDVFAVTARFFRDMSGSTRMPSTRDALYSFPFRFALASYVLALHWAVKGGYKTASARTIRNDFTDATYTSYSSFYDGLITADRKLAEICALNRWMLDNLFFAHVHAKPS